MQDDYSQLWIIILNSSFIGNIGGGLFSSITAQVYSLKILNSSFIANTAHGAKIINGRNDGIIILLQNSIFIENELKYGQYHQDRPGSGGMLHFDAAFLKLTLVITGCHFIDNKANSYEQGISAVIYLNLRNVQHVFLSIYDTNWYNNSGSQLVIKLQKQAKIFATDCTFQYGYNNGRAIYISASLQDEVDDINTIVRTVFQHNSALRGSGIHIENAQLTRTHIIGCVFWRNVAWEMEVLY